MRTGNRPTLSLQARIDFLLGLFVGLSSGINVAGAVRFAKESGPGQTIVTILCDSGQKYQSTLFNRDWLASNHLDPDFPLESVLG